MPGSGKVGFQKPPEPKFIRDLKAKVGYKEPVGLEAKMQINGYTGDMYEREDKEDEKPTVVVLKDGDLTEEEAKDLQKSLDKPAEEIPPADGRIMFKKPVKRTKDCDNNDKTESRLKKKKKETDKQLLSFDEDEEDE